MGYGFQGQGHCDSTRPVRIDNSRKEALEIDQYIRIDAPELAKFPLLMQETAPSQWRRQRFPV